MAVTITRTPWVDDDGTGTTGTVINNAVKTSLYNEIDAALAALQPAWVTIPFSAGNFTVLTGAGSITVDAADVVQYHYLVTGKTLVVALAVNTFTITGTVVVVGIQMPKAVVTPANAVGALYDGGGTVGVPLLVNLAAGSNVMSISRLDGAAWPVQTNTLYLRLTLIGDAP